MFEYLRKHPRIAVTGPQRSGTTIAAEMIAADTGFDYVDETEFGFYDLNRFLRLVKNANRVVIQCPHFLKYFVDHHELPIHVVLMRRDLADIRRSEARVGWNRLGRARELATFGKTRGDPAALKYQYWDTSFASSQLRRSAIRLSVRTSSVSFRDGARTVLGETDSTRAGSRDIGGRRPSPR